MEFNEIVLLCWLVGDVGYGCMKTLEFNQNVQGHTCTVVRNNGMRFLVTPTTRIPLEIASLGAGKDAWMRQAKARCLGCNEKFTLDELFSETPNHCAACSAKDLD